MASFHDTRRQLHTTLPQCQTKTNKKFPIRVPLHGKLSTNPSQKGNLLEGFDAPLQALQPNMVFHSEDGWSYVYSCLTLLTKRMFSFQLLARERDVPKEKILEKVAWVKETLEDIIDLENMRYDWDGPCQTDMVV